MSLAYKYRWYLAAWFLIVNALILGGSLGILSSSCILITLLFLENFGDRLC